MPFADKQRREEYAKAYREKNKDLFREYNAEYRKQNAEAIKTKKREYSARTVEQRAQYRIANKKKFLVYHCKSRAKKIGVDFDMPVEQITWPEVCPILGITLDYGARKPFQNNAPSIDRINPSGGYTLENVHVVSWRANFIKKNATKQEILLLAEYLKEKES